MAPIKHGKAVRKKITPEYSAWNSMKTRCYNPNYPGHKYYRYNGITVCDRWLNSFDAFLQDMGERPSAFHSLDRKDGNLGYYKENCRWATKAQQQENKSTNAWYEIDGKRMILRDWAILLEVKYQTLRMRIEKYGFEKAYRYFKK